MRDFNDHYDGDLLNLFMQFIANESTFGANILSVAILLEKYLQNYDKTLEQQTKMNVQIKILP